jgi:two-component system, cell cycle response regulator
MGPTDVPSPTDLAWMQRLELRVNHRFVEVAEAATRWLAQAQPEADAVLVRRMQLVLAVADTRRGRIENGAAVMRQIRDWAIEHDEGYLQARAERALGVLLRRAGEGATCLEHAVSSVRLLPADVDPAVRADHLIGLADALALCGSSEESIRRYREAATLLVLHGDPRLTLMCLNNLAYTMYEAGRLDEAVELCEEMQELTRTHGLGLPLHVLDTVANVYVAVGRLEAAERLFTMVDPAEDTAPEDVAESLLTLSRVRRSRGDLDGAQEALDRCDRACADHGLGGVEARALGERAELQAARGAYRLAFEQYRQFHERLLTQHAVEREARARMMQAIFETAEARRESARFREMSYRDALTGLYNRRYVDEHLAGVLETARHTDEPLSVAFVDLDHFKRVNDTCSHEVGDEVLRRVAALLEQATGAIEGGVAARMGGEEFLLVLPRLGAAAAGTFLERLRSLVETVDWAGLTRSVPVTASVGCATSPVDGRERLILLARADRRLYAAKDAGRNRVVTADEPSAAEVL